MTDEPTQDKPRYEGDGVDRLIIPDHDLAVLRLTHELEIQRVTRITEQRIQDMKANWTGTREGALIELANIAGVFRAKLADLHERYTRAKLYHAAAKEAEAKATRH